MADSYSVKAILSATDKGFSSTLRNASSAVDSLSSKAKGGFSFGVFAGIGQQAFNTVINGAKGLVGEINSSNKAWKTYEGNMRILGKTEEQIDSVRGTLQKFAEESIYSSSDMASTYAQLESVGTKSADKLVTGFGGLAAAAENPAQAMKTLSQQAVQMAARPSVQWADFKLMLEQTPAGMAAVAKEMGMTSSELVTKIKDGEVATEDFFAAINKVGNSDSFQKLATSYKGVDEAMAGLQETLGNKLTPAFDLLSTMAIGGISGIIDKISEIDGEALAAKVSAGIEKAQPYWETFKDIAGQVGQVIKTVGGFLLDHSDTIAKCIPYVLGLVAAYKAFKIVSSIASTIGGFTGKLRGVSAAQTQAGNTSATSGAQMLTAAKSYALMGVAVLAIAVGFALLAQSAIALSSAGGLAIGVMAGLVVGVAALGLGMALLLKSLAPMSAQLMPAAMAMLAMGAAVLLVSAGFALMAQTAIQLSSAGGLAIGMMVGMVAVMALLAIGAAALGPALTAGAVGFIAFGAAIALVGAGALMAAAALALISGVLPVIVEYGTQGATAIAALGAGMLAFAAGAALAGAAALVLGAGLTVAAVGIAAVGVAIAVLGAGVVVLAAGAIVAAGAIALLSVALPMVTSYGQQGAAAIIALSGAMLTFAGGAAVAGAGALVLGAGLTVAGAGALVAAAGMTVFGASMIVGAAGVLVMNGALKGVKSSMKSISSSAKAAESSLKSMQSAVSVVESGLDALGSKAKSAMSQITNAFDDTASKAQSAGQQLGTGFTQGMQAGLAPASGVASQAVMLVTSRLRAGYSGAFGAGSYISQGFAAGMMSCLGQIEAAAARMVAAAQRAIEAKAKIASPSKVTTAEGEYFGEGWVNGILSKVKAAKAAAEQLVTFPTAATPKLAGAYGGEMSAEYDYYRDAEYVIIVPVDIDGKEVARVTAPHMQSEINRNQTRENRRHGKA